jgi:hypothetical protein
VILHDGDPARCAVVLPGIRYFSQAPLLWFAREAALARGWSAVELDERAPRDGDPFEWMRERAEAALAATDAGTVVVIGKSLGSAAAPLAAARGLPAVWLTPLLDRPEVAPAVTDSGRPVLAVGSDADPTWAGGPPAAAAAAGLEVMELHGLDHSLQLAGDPLASLDALRAVTERVGAFLERVG